jgi:hypothetical protein
VLRRSLKFGTPVAFPFQQPIAGLLSGTVAANHSSAHGTRVRNDAPKAVQGTVAPGH